MAVHRRRRGAPKALPPLPPPQTEGTIVGKNEIYRWKNLVGPFLVHALLGPRTSRPPFYYFPGRGLRAAADGRDAVGRWTGAWMPPGARSARHERENKPNTSGKTPENAAHHRCVTLSDPEPRGPVLHFPHHLWW